MLFIFSVVAEAAATPSASLAPFYKQTISLYKISWTLWHISHCSTKKNWFSFLVIFSGFNFSKEEKKSKYKKTVFIHWRRKISCMQHAAVSR